MNRRPFVLPPHDLHKHEMQSGSSALKPFSLKIQNLCKSFGDQTILSNLSLDLPSGKIFCLMAPSGSGKTTLFRILLGLESADSGNVNVNFQTKTQAPPSSALPCFSAVFQEDRLCEEFCALDNVMLVSHGTFSRQDAYTALCALLPAEAITRPVSTLSGGQKRRVALCRALLAPSSILLMDEPFTGLDEETRGEVIRFLKPLVSKKVLLISTHQAEDAEALGAAVIHL
ncbi:ATP-binding cassette domain-containing protein [Brotaphodocola sp.]|uniref:ATP-binding cassette domain-containing protein n=1 Tax=Brotaphodocola sp. TaxID=3073577 RepID=UPI003D7D1525